MKASTSKKPPKQRDYDSDEEDDRLESRSPELKSLSDLNEEDMEDGDYDTDEGEDEQENPYDPSDPKHYEFDLLNIIKQFASHVAGITKDLEEKEEKAISDAKKKGKPRHKILWEHSTFKITFVKKMLFNFFGTKADRLCKYYIIYLFPLREWLLDRNEQFFLTANVFPGAPEADIKFFRNLWAIDGAMTREEKDICWDFWKEQIEIIEDWQNVSDWVVNPDEKLNIPNFDYKAATAHLKTL